MSARKVIRRTRETHPSPSPQPTPCRLWQGACNNYGYGQCQTGGRRFQMHRWVVETAGEDQFGTPWNSSLEVMHLCDNPPCYRFDHLRLGTHADNVADMASKARSTHGVRNPGAKLTEEQVLRIRARRRSGDRVVDIASDFGVTPSIVSRIVLGKLWSRLLISEQVTR